MLYGLLSEACQKTIHQLFEIFALSIPPATEKNLNAHINAKSIDNIYFKTSFFTSIF